MDKVFYAIQRTPSGFGSRGVYTIVKCLEDDEGIWRVRYVEFTSGLGWTSHDRRDEAIKRMRELDLLRRGEHPVFVRIDRSGHQTGKLKLITEDTLAYGG